MKKCLISNDFKSEDEFLPLCGVNLLHDIKPLVLDGDDKPFGGIRYQGEIDANSTSVIDNEFNSNPSAHIDFETERCKVIYDLGEVKPIDRIFISGFYDGKADYSLAEYKLYLSDDAKELFNEDNCIVHYNNGDLCDCTQEVRNHCDQIFDLEDYSGRYFAVELLKPNVTDDIYRVSVFGLYNHNHTEQIRFCKNTFGTNMLSGIIPSVKGAYVKDLSLLTDGICFDEEKRIYLNSETEFGFKLDTKMNLNSFFIIGSESAIDGCEVYISDDKESLFTDGNLIETESLPVKCKPQGVSAALIAICDDIEAEYIGFKFPKDCFIDQIGVKS